MTAELPYLIRSPVPEPSVESLPTVSFCIPTKNRVRTIEACLRSIRSQRYPNVEIVVVDNQSTDATPDIAKQYADRVLSSPGPLGRVRQVSVDAASGDILAIFDDDIVIPHEHWLRDAVRLFGSDSRVSTVWPRLVPPPSAGIFTRCFFDLNEVIFADRMAAGRGVFGGGNSLFRKSAFEAVGGFEVTADFGEDMILATRLRSAGFSVAYCADPLIHDTMYSLSEIRRKQLWGAGAIATSGWKLMDQGRDALLREQVLLGFKGMVRGLLARNPAWLVFPVLLATKLTAYTEILIREKVGR